MQEELSYNKAQRMLLGVAIGDSAGSVFENYSRDWIATHLDPDPGIRSDSLYPRYTDDTQMTLAIAELMISGLPFTRENIATFFMRAYHRDPRQGYSSQTYHQLNAGTGYQAFCNSLPEESKKERRSDGAAMRALPIGLYKKIPDVMHHAITNAETTHGHPHAIAASCCIAVLAHCLYYKKAPYYRIIPYIISNCGDQIPQDVVRIIRILSIPDTYSPERILGDRFRKDGVPYQESLPFLLAVLSLVMHYGPDMKEMLRQAILLGGDTDTVAAVALGAAALLDESTKNLLPYLDSIETGPFGRDFIIRIGKELNCRYPDS
ncbi:MAG: ADP-ribosylglycohydrolase family protein [Methanospirillaceae archaeon]|nr:ADP-ribosylglycohydrolase family protein [Methanospirillaceae archaeon]